ncbi:DUF3313 domain-containing protein [Yersinia proxima]|uniref:DUF3313 domain-containing protein n=1 Tax=Yersinia proxima TaxID=2890316 RepID=UPI000987ABA1|nr:DUF3313 domain-containing protein [Yersinia proxima]
MKSLFIGKFVKPLLLTIIFSTTIGCSSPIATQTEYSGFLGDYSQLTKAKSATGHEILRWVSPKLSSNKYTSIIYTPIIYYPKAQPTDRVSLNTLNTILDYTNAQVKGALAQQLALSSQKSPHTLIFKGAITSVNAENEGVQFYEVLPVTAVIAGTMAATGHRTQQSELFFEAELIDSETGMPVLKVVRKGYGKNLYNSQQIITKADVKQVIDNMVTDISKFDITHR